MFHVVNNLFFGRRSDGSVRIIKFNFPPNCIKEPLSAEMMLAEDGIPYDDERTFRVLFDATIPADVWASVVASVSARGEMDGRFYIAQKFHNESPATHSPEGGWDV